LQRLGPADLLVAQQCLGQLVADAVGGVEGCHRFLENHRQSLPSQIREPALLVADEPTTALDVTIQAQILALIRDLRDRHRTTVILIAHDLGVVAQLCDRAGVLYAGQLVEVAPVEWIFDRPEHPYTQALLAALPTRATGRGSLPVAAGRVPDLADPPPGCRFAPRCPVRMDACKRVPALTSREPTHHTACWHVEAEAAA
jgi:oligopeptide/dipeptide ABC transporter ATP-binding protein